jgi:hypothetical protein
MALLHSWVPVATGGVQHNTIRRMAGVDTCFATATIYFVQTVPREVHFQYVVLKIEELI